MTRSDRAVALRGTAPAVRTRLKKPIKTRAKAQFKIDKDIPPPTLRQRDPGNVYRWELMEPGDSVAFDQAARKYRPNLNDINRMGVGYFISREVQEGRRRKWRIWRIS